MTAGTYNVTIEQGATFSLRITYEDSSGAAVDLTAYTARMSVRRGPTSAEVVSLTTENSRIALGGTEGTVTLSMTAAETAALPAGEYVYDLELVSGGSVTRLLEGRCTIKAGITR